MLPPLEFFRKLTCFCERRLPFVGAMERRHWTDLATFLLENLQSLIDNVSSLGRWILMSLMMSRWWWPPLQRLPGDVMSGQEMGRG